MANQSKASPLAGTPEYGRRVKTLSGCGVRPGEIIRHSDADGAHRDVDRPLGQALDTAPSANTVL